MGEVDSQTTELLMVRFSEVVFIDDAFLAGLKTTGGSDYNQRAFILLFWALAVPASLFMGIILLH